MNEPSEEATQEFEFFDALRASHPSPSREEVLREFEDLWGSDEL